MKSALSFIFSCLLAFSTPVYGQDAVENRYPDYIVTNNNDTVKCRMSSRFLSLRLKYKTPGAKDDRLIDIDSIKAYYYSVDTSYFARKYLPSNKMAEFVKVLEKGQLNLYEFTVYKYDSFARGNAPFICWYAGQNAEGTLKIIRIDGVWPPGGKNVGSTSRKKQETDFVSMLADNSDLVARFKDVRKSTGYDWDLIRAYVKIYNDEYLESHKTNK